MKMVDLSVRGASHGTMSNIDTLIANGVLSQDQADALPDTLKNFINTQMTDDDISNLTDLASRYDSYAGTTDPPGCVP